MRMSSNHTLPWALTWFACNVLPYTHRHPWNDARYVRPLDSRRYGCRASLCRLGVTRIRGPTVPRQRLSPWSDEQPVLQGWLQDRTRLFLESTESPVPQERDAKRLHRCECLPSGDH